MTSEKGALKGLNFIARGATPGEDGKKTTRRTLKGFNPFRVGDVFLYPHSRGCTPGYWVCPRWGQGKTTAEPFSNGVYLA